MFFVPYTCFALCAPILELQSKIQSAQQTRAKAWVQGGRGIRPPGETRQARIRERTRGAATKGAAGEKGRCTTWHTTPHHTHTHTRARARARTCTHTCTRALAHAHTHTRRHTKAHEIHQGCFIHGPFSYIHGTLRAFICRDAGCISCVDVNVDVVAVDRTGACLKWAEEHG